jgi:hypothetical protein
MTFDEWWASYIETTSIYTLKETTEDAWEAGIQEGLRRNREWVGLTDEQLKETIRETIESVTVSQLVYSVAFARAIEAKLKEKNA